MNEIILYQTSDNKTELEVKFDGETFWMNQKQMAELFEKDTDTIGLHLKNIFAEEELEELSTTEFFSVVQKEGKRGVKKVNEQSGYAENLQLQEAKGLLDILSQYTRSFVLLNQYDSYAVKTGKLSEKITYEITYNEAKEAIAELKKQLIAKKEATELFGKEKDNGFQSSLQSVVQTFGGQYLYTSIEEQAAHLLYFVIKNHSFSDGNQTAYKNSINRSLMIY